MSGRGPRPRRWLAGLAAVLAVLVLGGCQVATTVTVRVGSDGDGTVTVTVTFDKAAAAAVGGVESQLRTSDLTAEGWDQRETVGGGGSTVVTLSHPFARLAQLQGILDEVARDPTDGTPLFELGVTRTRTFFRVTTAVTGRVDLTCGLSCFGDAALLKDYGSEVGVDPATIEGAGGAATAARDLPFTLALRLPGRVTSSDSPDGSTALQWHATLGGRTPVAAAATAVDSGRVAEASAAGGVTVVVVVVVIVLAFVALRRRGTRRRLRAGRHRAGRR